jgi:hypothetical protein
MTAGGYVWIGIAGALLCWTVMSAARRGIPGPVAVLGWFTRSWLGRALALCAWAGAGWHLFCQRP